jgi:hypothetical protein
MADYVKGLFGGASSVSSALPSDAGKKKRIRATIGSSTLTDIGMI